jgi:hypothetical protein
MQSHEDTHKRSQHHDGTLVVAHTHDDACTQQSAIARSQAHTYVLLHLSLCLICYVVLVVCCRFSFCCAACDTKTTSRPAVASHSSVKMLCPALYNNQQTLIHDKNVCVTSCPKLTLVWTREAPDAAVASWSKTSHLNFFPWNRKIWLAIINLIYTGHSDWTRNIHYNKKFTRKYRSVTRQWSLVAACVRLRLSLAIIHAYHPLHCIACVFQTFLSVCCCCCSSHWLIVASLIIGSHVFHTSTKTSRVKNTAPLLSPIQYHVEYKMMYSFIKKS